MTENNQLNSEGMPAVDGADNQIDSNGLPAEREATKRIDSDMEKMC